MFEVSCENFLAFKFHVPQNTRAVTRSVNSFSLYIRIEKRGNKTKQNKTKGGEIRHIKGEIFNEIYE